MNQKEREKEREGEREEQSQKEFSPLYQHYLMLAFFTFSRPSVCSDDDNDDYSVVRPQCSFPQARSPSFSGFYLNNGNQVT
jgi:hypothetical protein